MTNRTITRRDFLKAATAAAVVSPHVVPASVLGADGSRAPSERIVLGFIGIGGMGGGHLGNFLNNKDVHISSVCDVDSRARSKAQGQVEARYGGESKSGAYKGCAAYSDFREILVREDIDAVVIATPDHWHALIAIAAAKAGKDVYCEKPLSLTIREARAMVSAVRRYGRIFQTGSQQRSEFAGRFRFACEMVRNDRIGKLLTAHVSVGGPSEDCYLPPEPVPQGFDWEMWLGPAPWRPYNHGIHPRNWRRYRDYSGGGMTDWGAHHFDIVQWALDMDKSGPVEIYPPNGKEHERLTFKYANGVEVYHGGYPRGGNGILFTGTDGKIEVNRRELHTYPESIAKEPICPNEVHLYYSESHRGNWLECIRTRRLPICDVEVGCRSVTVCHLGNIAYWLERPLKWDPVNEQFVGDDEANRWLDRPKRAPWRLG